MAEILSIDDELEFRLLSTTEITTPLLGEIVRYSVVEHLKGLKLDDNLQTKQYALELIDLLTRSASDLGIKPTERFKRIRHLYFELGIARLLTMGDWSIERNPEAVAGALGFDDLRKTERTHLEFLEQNGLLNAFSHDDSIDNHIIELDLGPGNAELNEILNRDRNILFQGRPLSEYILRYGFGNHLYFSLNSLILDGLRDDYRYSPDLSHVREFVHVICTLLLRQIYYSQKFPETYAGKAPTLCELPKNLNFLREILVNLPYYIDIFRLVERGGIQDDGEFLADTPRSMSEECKTLFREFYPQVFDPNLHATGDVKPTLLKLHHYFKSHFFNFESIDYEKGEIRLAKEQGELSEMISIYPDHTIMGQFEELDRLLPALELFDIVRSCRGFSHLENKSYQIAVFVVCMRLKYGGIFLDDGIRESYTRDERIPELIEVMNTLNQLSPEDYQYRFHVIACEDVAKSVFIQRSIPREGTHVFYSDGQTNSQLYRGCAAIPIDQYWRNNPVHQLRTDVIRSLKHALNKDASKKEVRMQFKFIHGAPDRMRLSLDDTLKRRQKSPLERALYKTREAFERALEEYTPEELLENFRRKTLEALIHEIPSSETKLIAKIAGSLG